MDRANLAVKYARLGFKIVILHGINEEGYCTCSKGKNCKSSGKHPIYSGWGKNLSEDEILSEFKNHPYANIGFATGANFFVLDIDKDHGGYESINKPLNKTLSVRTGSGGSHHYFLIPENVEVTNRTAILPGVDIRSNGGLVVAPGSKHKNGKEYQWIAGCSPDTIEIAEPNPWLLDLILNKKTKFNEIPDTIDEGSRNSILASIAGSLRRKGLSYEAIYAALMAENENRCNPPLYAYEVEGIAKSISRYKPEDPITGDEWDEIKKEDLFSVIESLKDYSKVFEQKILSLIFQAKENDPVTYAIVKTKLKGKVNLRDLDKAIKHLSQKQNNKSNFKKHLRLKGLKANPFITPYGWKVDLLSGVSRFVENRDGLQTEETVSFAPIVISRRFHNIDTDNEKIELSFYRDRCWKKALAPRSIIFNRNSILKLADISFPVSSNNAGDLISYLTDFEKENDNIIPIVKSVSRLGWLKDGRFFPYIKKGSLEFENLEFENDISNIIEGLEPSGNKEKWLEIALKVRTNPAARFMISASFASALLEPLQKRVFFIHLWNSSRSGKTAILKFAIAAWGNPLKLIGSFNSTIVGLERLVGGLRNLPFAIDELQVLNTKRMSTDRIVYMLCQGQGRTRGNKDGGLQKTLTWRNIILTTGEEAMFGSNMQDGANTRVFELYEKPLEDIQLAVRLHEIAESHYGHAGRAFIEGIDKKSLESKYNEIKDVLLNNYPKSIHLNEVAVVCLGDYLSSMHVFGEDEKTAMQGALKSSFAMLENNRQLMETDNIERAWDMFKGWIIANGERFCSSSMPPLYGRVDKDGNYLVIPSYANKALIEEGFSPKKVFRGFAERGYIVSKVDSEGINRLQIGRSILGKTCRVYIVRVPKDEIDECENLFE